MDYLSFLNKNIFLLLKAFPGHEQNTCVGGEEGKRGRFSQLCSALNLLDKSTFKST